MGFLTCPKGFPTRIVQFSLIPMRFPTYPMKLKNFNVEVSILLIKYCWQLSNYGATQDQPTLTQAEPYPA